MIMHAVKAAQSETRTPQNQSASTRTDRWAHLLWRLQPLLQLEPQLVGGQPELGALWSQDPLS